MKQDLDEFVKNIADRLQHRIDCAVSSKSSTLISKHIESLRAVVFKYMKPDRKGSYYWKSIFSHMLDLLDGDAQKEYESNHTIEITEQSTTDKVLPSIIQVLEALIAQEIRDGLEEEASADAIKAFSNAFDPVKERPVVSIDVGDAIPSKTYALVNEIVSGHSCGLGRLNGAIKIEAVDQPGLGGAHHHYRFYLLEKMELDIEFQNGPISDEASLNGWTNEAFLAMLIHRMDGFCNGPFKHSKNVECVSHLRAALSCLHERTAERVERKVEGTLTP